MDRPPARIIARRAQRRAQLRRRRLAGLGVTIVLVGLLLVELGSGGGHTSAVRVASVPGGARHGNPSLGVRRLVDGRLARSAGSRVIRRLLALGLPIYCGARHGHAVAFTFDDGPGVYTYLAIRKLARARERATFFDVGRSMEDFPGYIPRELKVGAIGDHTYTHPALIALSPGQITYQLQATARKIEAQSHQPVVLFRPPYELHNATVDRIAQGLGLLEILWDVDSQDSLGANYAGIIKNVEAGLRPGAIVEMHENRGQTIRALTTLLPVLRRRHLRSVTVPELLASDPPSASQVRRGLKGCGVAGEARSGPSE